MYKFLQSKLFQQMVFEHEPSALTIDSWEDHARTLIFMFSTRFETNWKCASSCCQPSGARIQTGCRFLRTTLQKVNVIFFHHDNMHTTKAPCVYSCKTATLCWHHHVWLWEQHYLCGQTTSVHAHETKGQKYNDETCLASVYHCGSDGVFLGQCLESPPLVLIFPSQVSDI